MIRLPIAFAVLFPLFLSSRASAAGSQDPWAVPAATPVRVRPPAASGSAGGAIGLGVAVGSPTGLAGKYRLAPKSSIDAALAYDSNLYLHSDYLFEGRPLFPPRTVRLTWFAGAGARMVLGQSGSATGGVAFGAATGGQKGNPHGNGNGGGGGTSGGGSSLSGNLGLGARVPAGLEMRFRKAPRLEVFGEAALDVGVVGLSGTSIDGALGGRWYF